MSGKLSQSDLERARRDGSIFPLRIMTPDQAESYRRVYEETEARQGRDVPETLSVKPHLLFRWLFELGTTPALLDAIEDLIGQNILMTTSAIWAKHARDPRLVTWHQDSAYFGYDPLEVWGAWIALTDSNANNGCLRYLPGSHTKPELPHEETWDAENMLSRGQRIIGIDDSDAVNVELEPGECTIHHFRLAHSSEPNRSDRRRIGILFVFCPPHVRPTLANMDTALLVRGEDRHGHWKPEPRPKRDLDPECLDYYNAFLARYTDPETRSEAERQHAL